MRLNIVRRIIVVLVVLIAANLFSLQVLRGAYFARLGLSNSMRVVPFEGVRGRIFDRNGTLLADNIKAYHAVVIPQDIANNKAMFAFIGDIVGADPRVIEKRYFRNKITPFSPATLADDLSRAQAIKIEENSFRFPGLMVLEKFSRRYLSPENNAHLLGYVGKADQYRLRRGSEYGYSSEDVVGYSGIEEYYDDILRSTPGGRQIEVNSRGRQTQLLSVREPVDGKSLVLTVDNDMQGVAREALSGRRGAIVVLDPANGEVLTLVSSPGFNPNAFIEKDDRERVSEYLRSTDSPLLNRAVSGSFPPGSVFKIVVGMGALEDNRIKPSVVFDCPGSFQLGDRTYNFPHAWGSQDLTAALAHSANEYFFHLGLMMGSQAMVKYASAFGLGSRTGIDLPYEAKGNLPGIKVGKWFKGDTVNTAIGQGYVLATPIQLARLMATVENKGFMPRVHLLLKDAPVGNLADKSVSKDQLLTAGTVPQMTHVSFRKDVWAAIYAGLEAVVSWDTGSAHMLANLPGVFTYGKTGTAQSSGNKEDHAWFAGVSRTDKRVIAYCVFLEHGGSSANSVKLTYDFLSRLRELGKI